MSVFQKLNTARLKFHESSIKKTGWNDFSKYNYFELADFLIPALRIFDEVGLCAVVSFGNDLAEMKIVDIETGESTSITSPMSQAQLKACHPVQNLGAVQTYLRRYLWTAALEIVEHDVIDSSPGIDADKQASTLGQAQQDTAREQTYQTLVRGILSSNTSDELAQWIADAKAFVETGVIDEHKNGLRNAIHQANQKFKEAA